MQLSQNRKKERGEKNATRIDGKEVLDRRKKKINRQERKCEDKHTGEIKTKKKNRKGEVRQRKKEKENNDTSL